MTDEELNALDEVYDTMMEVQLNPTGAWQAIQDQADAITTLRSQLAAARAERDVWEIDAKRNHQAAEIEFARAEQAEAALAAQIEADMETCGQCMGSGYGGHPDSGVSCPVCGGSGGVRNQPHDRTALDRYREKALREAVRSLRRRKAVYLLKARKAMRSAGEVQDPDLQSQQWEKSDQMMHTAEAHDYAIADILALIEKPNAR